MKEVFLIQELDSKKYFTTGKWWDGDQMFSADLDSARIFYSYQEALSNLQSDIECLKSMDERSVTNEQTNQKTTMYARQCKHKRRA